MKTIYLTKALGTDGRTDGQSLLMRCEDASKKMGGQKSSWRNVSPFGGFGGGLSIQLLYRRLGKKEVEKKLLYSILYSSGQRHIDKVVLC